MPGASSTYFPVRGRTSSASPRQNGPPDAFPPSMGDVISLSQVRAARAESTAGGHIRSGHGPRVTFFFDLLSPWTYLAAERAERLFGSERRRPAIGDPVARGGGRAERLLGSDRWRPAMGGATAGGRTAPAPRDDAEGAAAERRAEALRLPLVWPQGWPLSGRAAMRAAALAAERGRAAPFV